MQALHRGIVELEREARVRADRRIVETLEQMNERHLKIAKALQGKALESLRSLPIDKAADVIRALELGVKQERLIQGEPSERAEMSVEEITKREMQRWLVVGSLAHRDDLSDQASYEPDQLAHGRCGYGGDRLGWIARTGCRGRRRCPCLWSSR